MNRMPITRIRPITPLPSTAYSPPVNENSRQVIATAPTAGPAQWRVPPRMLMSTTVSGTVRLKVSAVVT